MMLVMLVVALALLRVPRADPGGMEHPRFLCKRVKQQTSVIFCGYQKRFDGIMAGL